MKTPFPDSARRVLVTGSRGKSSIVRLLHTAFQAAGIESWARITGVEPRQLGPGGTQTILRTSGAHVEEMRWWLRQLPASAGAVVMENSAISPELQPLAARWLQPEITVLSNVLPDHQEAWGPTAAGAAEALVAGLPKGGQVIMPEPLRENGFLASLVQRRQCTPLYAVAEGGGATAYRAVNFALAKTVLEALGLPVEAALDAMKSLQPDRYDFRVLEHDGARMAMAFSANDIASTRSLFHGLDWPAEQTRLVYNHRSDRPARLRSFCNWLESGRWREVLIIGDRPLRRPDRARFMKLDAAQNLLSLVRPGDRVFGCGNIAGHPLALY
jgi:hypothetical protein